MVGRRELKSKKLEKDIKKEERKEKNIKLGKKIFKILLIIVLVISALLVYMHSFGTKGLKVKEYLVVNNKLPDKFNGLKVVHFSDLYYLSNIKEKELTNVVDKINELKPDIVVFTGDLINDYKTIEKEDINILTKNLNNINAKIGKYIIKGDLDYNSTYNEIIEKTDFTLINNSYELIYYKDNTPILLTGIGSCIKEDCDINQAFSFDKIENIYTISLIHEADAIDKIINNQPDLVLAGHSLNGQIRLPLIGGLKKLEYAKKYTDSKYKINNTDFFVSGGIGTNKYSFRFFNHPSINFYRIVKETN